MKHKQGGDRPPTLQELGEAAYTLLLAAFERCEQSPTLDEIRSGGYPYDNIEAYCPNVRIGNKVLSVWGENAPHPLVDDDEILIVCDPIQEFVENDNWLKSHADEPVIASWVDKDSLEYRQVNLGTIAETAND